MAEGEFDAFRPIKHPMGFEYVPAAPQQPSFFEQREIIDRNLAKIRKALGKRGLQPSPEEQDEYHSGVILDDDEFYIRFRDDY